LVWISSGRIFDLRAAGRGRLELIRVRLAVTGVEDGRRFAMPWAFVSNADQTIRLFL
jgi:hypothetical protein